MDRVIILPAAAKYLKKIKEKKLKQLLREAIEMIAED